MCGRAYAHTHTHTCNTYSVWRSPSFPLLFHAHWLLFQLLVLASLCLRALCGHEACPDLAQAGRKCQRINTSSFRSSLNLWVSGMVYKNHSFLILWRELVQHGFPGLPMGCQLPTGPIILLSTFCWWLPSCLTSLPSYWCLPNKLLAFDSPVSGTTFGEPQTNTHTEHTHTD